MASKAEAEKVRLECPLCLDNFKNATLLNCGHTFCKGCLEEYDEQHDHLDHLVCPVCRQNTQLGANRVSGLTPNFSVKGVEDKLNVNYVHLGDQEAEFCSIHKTVYKDIFCVDCEIFICLSCYIDTHKDHKIIKKEELGRNLRERRDSLVKKSDTVKTRIEMCLEAATEEDEGIHRHLNNLEKDIKDKSARKVKVLRENEEVLLKRVEDIRKQSDEQSQRYITHHSQLIDNINSSMTLLTNNLSESLDLNTLQAYLLQCHEIDDFLKQNINIDHLVHLGPTVKNARFSPADDKLLALGHIEQGVKATGSSVKHAKTATDKILALEQGVKATASSVQHLKPTNGVGQNVEELQASGNIAELPHEWIPALGTLKIVREVRLSFEISGMTSLSQDAVVVGYGMYRTGADCFCASGDKKPHLGSEVGNVFGIALLTDGRSVVSHGKNIFQVYDKQGNTISGMAYTCTSGSSYHVCSDKHDNIFVVNGTLEVSIFNGNSTLKFFMFRGKKRKLKRVVLLRPTGNIKRKEPNQILVTKQGVMITTTSYSTVTVFDSKGHAGTSITANDDEECLYAAVDSQDRVLVARARWRSHTMELTRYTLQGLTLTEEVTFNPLKLNKPCQYGLSYMVSLKPNMIAFVNQLSLYFIQMNS